MPVSQGSAGGLPGLNLKAWAQVNSAGVLVRGFNVASASRGAVGSFVVFLSAPVSGRAVVKLTAEHPAYFALANPISGTAISVGLSSAAAPVDTWFYIEVYD